MRKSSWRSLAVLLALSVTSTAFAHDLGVVGKVYPIKERDALEEIEERAAKLDWAKESAKVKPERYRPQNSRSLPRATKDRSFLVDVTYTLSNDIPDGNGGILYPEGFTLNPLDYVPWSPMVVLNGEDKAQVEWFKASEYAKRIDVTLAITEGPFVDLREKLGRKVFYSDQRIVDRFNLVAVPAVISQSGKMILVEEYDVRPKKKH